MEEHEVQSAVRWKNVCEIATGLARAYKTRQLYAPNNPVRRTCLEKLLWVLTSFLRENDTLTFSVTETQLIYHGKAVYANPDRRESLVFRLFRDGVRTLSFHAGITGEEMAELLDALGQASVEGEEGDTDVVTQMWERDLVHVTYIAVDDCLDYEDPEVESSKQAQPAEGRRSGPAQAAQAAEGAVGLATMTDVSFSEQEKRSIADVSLSEEELEEIGHQLLALEREAPQEKVSRIFLEILRDPSNSEVRTDVVRGLGALCGDLLEAGNAAQAAAMLREIRGLLVQEPPSPEELVRTVRSFLEMRGEDRELVRLEPRLEEAALRELEEYEVYLRELLPNSVHPLCELLGRMRSRKGREMLCRAISVLAKENLEALADSLSDPRWYLVRNVVHIFRLMKDRRVLVYLEGLLSHEEARVRTEIVHCLAEMGGHESEMLLSTCLHDPEEKVRVLAARKLGRLGGESAASAIADCIKEKAFTKRYADEKREFFDALGRSATDDFVPFLERFIRKRTFFRSAESDEMKKCAAIALARIGTARACELLEQTARNRGGSIRKYCTEALRLCNLTSPHSEGAPDEEPAGVSQENDVSRRSSDDRNRSQG